MMDFISKKFVLLFILILFSCATTKENAKENEYKLLGKTTWTEWKEKSGWDLIPTYEYYFPDKEKMEILKKLIQDKDYKFIVFATTFCEECEENVPKAFKIFHSIEVPAERIELYGLDEKLEEPTQEFKKYDIPTTPVIFIKHNNEVIAEISYPFLWLESFIEVFESIK